MSGITPTGSNQFVVGGPRAAGGIPVSEKDPHNYWSEAEPYLHLRIGDLDVFGNGLLGSYACGATSRLTFGCTRAGTTPGARVRAAARPVGTVDSGTPCGTLQRWEAFDHRANQSDGGYVLLDSRCASGRWLYSSRFGPADELDGGFVTFGQIFAASDVSTVDYDVGMVFRSSVSDFLATFRAQTPREDGRYRALADPQGNIGFVLGAAVPGLNPALDWSSPVPATDPRIDSWTPFDDWSRFIGVAWHNVDGAGLELPHVVNPAGNFVQNCNGNPQYSTEPIGQVGPVPAYIEHTAGPTEREVRLRQLLGTASAMTLDQAEAVALDVKVLAGERLAEAIRCRVVPDGLDPVALYGDGGRLMQLFLGWGAASGFQARPDSVEMTALYAFDGLTSFPNPYPALGTCFTRAELDVIGANLRDVVAVWMRNRYTGTFTDPLRVPWGYVNTVRIGGVDRGMPGGGGTTGRLSTLFTSYFQLDNAIGRARAGGWRLGSKIPQVSTWTDAGLETRISVPHGQTDSYWYPSSPHLGQTADDFVNRRMRRVWLSRREVEANLCPWGLDGGTHEHRSVRSFVLP